MRPSGCKLVRGRIMFVFLLLLCHRDMLQECSMDATKT